MSENNGGTSTSPLCILLILGLLLYLMNQWGIAPTSIPIISDLAEWLQSGTNLLIYFAICIAAHAVARGITIAIESEIRQGNLHKDHGPLDPERDQKAIEGREPRTLGELAAKQREDAREAGEREKR